MSLLVMG
uniref:Uncharacterized protein n=1 Tax=Oryza glumipatula TaxID=40148 RepID=A0A1Y8Z4N6_9ORYZ